MTEITDHIPHPGSRTDAVNQAAQQEIPAVQISDVAGDDVFVVPVAEQLPALGRGYVVTLSAANPVLSILPRDDRRRRALVLAVDNDVYLASSKNGAQMAAGTTTGTTAFYLPAGIAIPVDNKASWHVGATTTATNSRVSVLISLDGE